MPNEQLNWMQIMSQPNTHGSLRDIVNRDDRYPVDAYEFVEHALAYASDTMELGCCHDADGQPAVDEFQQAHRERHLTGQQLCEAIRQYSLNQFGYMAKTVLGAWGINSTSCFGNIVYNMIEAGRMKKSSHDERSHFDNVFQFEDAFENQFEISCRQIAHR